MNRPLLESHNAMSDKALEPSDSSMKTAPEQDPKAGPAALQATVSRQTREELATAFARLGIRKVGTGVRLLAVVFARSPRLQEVFQEELRLVAPVELAMTVAGSER